MIKYGLGYLFILLFSRLFGIPLEIEKTKQKLLNFVINKHDYTVAYGVFKGMRLSKATWWSKYDLISQTLGTYEAHVVREVKAILRAGLKNFIDIGAADGYFAVGTIYAGMYQKAYAFESSARWVEIRSFQNAKQNKCDKNVFVFGDATAKSINEILEKHSKDAILIDIEGREYEFLTTEMLHSLGNAISFVNYTPGWLKMVLLSKKNY